jgi:hypothetical protein
VKYVNQYNHNVKEEEGNNMRYLFYILIFLNINFSYAQPVKEKWDLTDKTWQPSEPIEWVFPDGFSMETIFLFQGVESPFDGLILLTDDWSEIRRIVNNIQKDKDKIKKEERLLCDSLLEERDKKCKDLNLSLLQKIDLVEEKNDNLNKQFNSLEEDHFYLKILSTVVVSGLSTYIIIDKLKN